MRDIISTKFDTLFHYASVYPYYLNTYYLRFGMYHPQPMILSAVLYGLHYSYLPWDLPTSEYYLSCVLSEFQIPAPNIFFSRSCYHPRMDLCPLLCILTLSSLLSSPLILQTSPVLTFPVCVLKVRISREAAQRQQPFLQGPYRPSATPCPSFTFLPTPFK